VKHWGLTWDLAAYKKQLPDLLAQLSASMPSDRRSEQFVRQQTADVRSNGRMTWPNKLPLPTPASGTPAVGAPVAPTSGAADFSMKDSGAAAIVETKKAVIFDLFHTLTSLESTLSPGRRTTSDMLGVSQEAWNDQLLKKSRDRLVGSKKDAFEIIAGMARAIDRSISDEKIKAATENRIAQFAAALTAIPAETITVLGS